jgi:putative membrane protein insertion efficiency factor
LNCESKLNKLALGLIRLYQQTISAVLPPSCRFSPSCSHYTYEAIARYGVLKGVWLGIGRLSRCHPFHEGGYDPVP